MKPVRIQKKTVRWEVFQFDYWNQPCTSFGQYIDKGGALREALRLRDRYPSVRACRVTIEVLPVGGGK